MQLFKWDSLLPIDDLFGDDLPLLESTGVDLAVDVYQTDDGVNVEMQVPGINPDAYEVKVEDGMLIVSGKRDKETEVEDKDYYRKEIHRGAFERQVKLPDVELKTDELNPLVEGGTLKLFIPKA